jgi:hypothetical protein
MNLVFLVRLHNLPREGWIWSLFNAIAQLSKDEINTTFIQGNDHTTFQGWDEPSLPSAII